MHPEKRKTRDIKNDPNICSFWLTHSSELVSRGGVTLFSKSSHGDFISGPWASAKGETCRSDQGAEGDGRVEAEEGNVVLETTGKGFNIDLGLGRS